MTRDARYEPRTTPLADGTGRQVVTLPVPGLDGDGHAVLIALSAVYDGERKLLYREMHRKRDLEDCWRQHEGVLAGVLDGRIPLALGSETVAR